MWTKSVEAEKEEEENIEWTRKNCLDNGKSVSICLIAHARQEIGERGHVLGRQG